MCLHTLHELSSNSSTWSPKKKQREKSLVESDFDSLSYTKAKHIMLSLLIL